MYVRVGDSEFFRPQVLAGMKKENHGGIVEETLFQGRKGIEQRYFIIGRRGVRKKGWRRTEEHWTTYHADLTDEEAKEWLEKNAPVPSPEDEVQSPD